MYEEEIICFPLIKNHICENSFKWAIIVWFVSMPVIILIACIYSVPSLQINTLIMCCWLAVASSSYIIPVEDVKSNNSTPMKVSTGNALIFKSFWCAHQADMSIARPNIWGSSTSFNIFYDSALSVLMGQAPYNLRASDNGGWDWECGKTMFVPNPLSILPR